LKYQVDQKENLDVIPDPLERTRSILEPGIVVKSQSPERTVKQALIANLKKKQIK